MQIIHSERYDISNNKKFIFMASIGLSLIVFGFIVDTPLNIYRGLITILSEPDTLITDYIGLGGLGAAFINSGLLTILFTYMLYKMRIQFNGATFASLFLISGFAFFGKNLFNVWFIVLGVYFYARYQKEHFKKYVYIALFGTAMAPMVSEILFNTNVPITVRLVLGVGTGVLIGFILPPLSTYLLRVHQGFNLYNIGFAAGIIGTIIVSVYKSYGFLPEARMIWTSGNNVILSSYLYMLSFMFIAMGYTWNGKSFKDYREVLNHSGRLVTDFTLMESYPVALINMGFNGIIAISYILLIGGDINGPTIGGIFTIIGFSAFGKHPRNILPIFLGVLIGSLTKVWGINDPSIQLVALFATGLAPLAGEYGWKVGAIAAFIHSSVALNVGILHGGLNLYNNGFAAGLVAAFIVPIINAFRKDRI